LAAEFMSCDYELNIRNTWNENFPLIRSLGCHFHYSQSLMKQVNKDGMQLEYSQNCAFQRCVQACVGLAYFPPERVATDGIRAIRLESAKLRGRAGRWTTRFIDCYFVPTWLEGQFELETWNFYEHPGGTTNNAAEGYNFRLNGKISSKPNPYRLAGVIKKELKIAAVKAEGTDEGVTEAKEYRKYEKLVKFRKKMAKKIK